VVPFSSYLVAPQGPTRTAESFLDLRYAQGGSFSRYALRRALPGRGSIFLEKMDRKNRSWKKLGFVRYIPNKIHNSRSAPLRTQTDEFCNGITLQIYPNFFKGASF